MLADLAAHVVTGPGGHQGNNSDSSAAGSHARNDVVEDDEAEVIAVHVIEQGNVERETHPVLVAHGVVSAWTEQPVVVEADGTVELPAVGASWPGTCPRLRRWLLVVAESCASMLRYSSPKAASIDA